MSGDAYLGIFFITLVVITAIILRWCTILNERAIKRQVEQNAKEKSEQDERERIRVRKAIHAIKMQAYFNQKPSKGDGN